MKHRALLFLALLIGVWIGVQPRLAALPVSLPQATDKQAASGKITTPKEILGFNIGDDYQLANYQQLKRYWEKLATESDRIKVSSIGLTEEGRPQLMAIVTSPENHRKLARYQEISRRLGQAEGVSEAEAEALAEEGKAVVWIDAGIHATEVLCPQMLIETVYHYVSANDKETRRILNDVVILFVHANPDGMDLVSDHYMKTKEPTNRRMGNLGRLYQKYVGHDNNRDFFANTQSETKNMNRVMYREWVPQIMYNHHQTGPQGTVLFCPPFRDPFNYNCDPLVISGIDAVGAAMMQRFLAEGKPGATSRSGAPYSTWFNGGLRTTTSFHNIIGLLTESIGSPTPVKIPYNPGKLLPKADYLSPIPPQEVWHFRQSVEYSLTANKAVLDYASRNREQLLHNIWVMGKRAIDRGNSDSWTVTPKVVAAARGNAPEVAADDPLDPDAVIPKGAGGKGGGKAGGGKGGFGKGGGKGGTVKDYERQFHDPAKRDPRGFILPSDQADFLTATKFINALLGTGVKVHRATADFDVAGKKYPKGSYVVKSGQAFRAHVMDMFEPQDHPNDFAYPGGPPVKPYDAAGYTMAFTMAVQFDRILDAFTGPFEEIKDLVVPPPPASVAGADGAVGFFLSTRINDSFRAVNQLQKQGQEVRRLREPFTANGQTYEPGTFFVPKKATTLPALEKIGRELGTPFRGSAVAPGKEAVTLHPTRIALWDSYGGSMPSGWTRWILERFDFNFRVVTTDELDEGKLKDKFDAIVLVTGATGSFEQSTTAQVKKFLEAGGTVLAIGSSTNLGRQLGLPIANHLQNLSSDKYYVPPSVLRARVDPAQPLAWGIGDQVDVMFGASPTFKLEADAGKKGLTRVAWFDSKTPLRSGWAWGQQYLENGTAMIDAKIGQGRLGLFGPEILFRAQPHGTFKFLFNGIVQSTATE
jgi:hypothetical protein